MTQPPRTPAGRGGAGRREQRSARRRGPVRCVVTAVSRPTPRTVRVEIAGLAGVEPTGPDQRVTLAFPTGRTFGADPAEAAAARRRRRTYTLLDLDPETGSAAIEFVVHGAGIAGPWAQQAQPGDELDVTGPIGRFDLDADAAEHVLICDETGIPAARAILRGRTAGMRVRVYAEVSDAAERVDLGLRAEEGTGSPVTWLERGARAPGEAMAALVGEVRFEPSAQVWVAGEASAVRALRTHLVAELGLERRRVTAVAYWTAGHAEGDPASGRPGEHD